MPVHLREQLHDAAARSGRSINAELVHRLERSLAREQRVLGRLRHRQGEGSMRRRTVRRWSIAAGVVASGSIAVALAFALNGAAPAAPAVESEGMPTALAGHLARLQALPGNGGMAAEGPGAAADSEFRNLAYPDTTVSVAEMNGAREAFTDVAGVPYRAGEGDGRWETIGPSRALYPRSDFLTSFLYVPNTYVAGGRTTVIAISDHCTPGRCEAVHHACGRRRVAHEERPRAETSTGSTWAARSASTPPASVTIDPNDPSGNTVYVGTGEANICGSRLRRRHRPLQVDQRRPDLDGPLGKHRVRRARASARSSSSPATRTRSTSLRRPPCAACPPSCCSGVTRPVPGIAKWGLYKSTDGGATWSFIHNGSADVADCTGDLTEFNNVGDLLAARRAGRRARPVEPGHRLRVVLRTRRLALERRRRDLDADQAVAQRGDHPDAAGDRRQPAAERQDPDVRLRGAHDAAHQYLAAVPQRRRRDGRAGLHRPDQPDPARPGLRHVQPLRRAVLVRPVRLHAEGPPGHGLRRAARTRTARASPTSAASSSRRMPASAART